MKDCISQMIRKIRNRLKLRKIEKAIDIKLNRRQRKAILNSNRPTFQDWGRASGKTITSCIWTMIWHQEPISILREERVLNPQRWHEYIQTIPDPNADNLRRMRYTLGYYGMLVEKCLDAGIEIKAILRR